MLKNSGADIQEITELQRSEHLGGGHSCPGYCYSGEAAEGPSRVADSLTGWGNGSWTPGGALGENLGEPTIVNTGVLKGSSPECKCAGRAPASA